MENTQKKARRDIVLNAAFETFVTYGFKRTSMEDIAKAAGMSRPALYTHFKNKSDIFRAYVMEYKQEIIKNIPASFETNDPFFLCLQNALNDIFVAPYEMVESTPHGAELVGVNKEITGDLFDEWLQEIENELVGVFTRKLKNNEIEIIRNDTTVKDIAGVIVDAMEGIKMREIKAAKMRIRIKALIELVKGTIVQI